MHITTLLVLTALSLLAENPSVSAWTALHGIIARPQRYHVSRRRLSIRMSDGGDDTIVAGPDLTEEEWNVIKELHEKGSASLKDSLLEALPTMNPRLIAKLRQGQLDTRKEFQTVSTALNDLLDSRLSEARDLLEELLEAGEIRKLDAAIGKAARAGKLDVPFFQVLNMNLMDAAKANPARNDEEDETKDEKGDDATTEPTTTSRYQILQHIYTRCQEEVEKTVPPGVALLNKLLRTESQSIRANQLQHYLLPQPNVIKTPDGKELELQGGGGILVPHEEFVNAIGNAVKQIRTVEKAGGASKVVTAGMVESCRQVAKEARVTIGERFSRESDELRNFEDGLMPVFRPSSSDSPYIQGE